MGNLLTSFNTGVSGLHSAQTSLYTAGHNLANATTEGHSRQQVMVTDAFYRTSYGNHANTMQIGMGTNVATIRQVRNTFLDGQYRLQLGREKFYDAQYRAVTEIQDVFGEMQGEQFQYILNEGLWAALSDLRENPDKIVYRTEMVAMASKFIERASVLQNELYQYQQNMNQEVQQQVDRINSIVEEIGQYNVLIRQYEATGEGANDYRDARNLLLDELGGYINFHSMEEVDGTISIFSQNAYLLEGNTQYRLATEFESATSHLLKPVWEIGRDDFFIRNELSYSMEDNSDTGSLRGLLVARGTHSTDYTDLPQKPLEKDYTNEAGEFDAVNYQLAMNSYQLKVEEYNKTVQPSIVMTVQAQFDRLINGITTMINDTFCPNKEITVEVDGQQQKIKVLDTEKSGIGDDADQSMGVEIFVRRKTPRYTEKEMTVVKDDGTKEKQTVLVYNEEDPNDEYTLYSIDQLEVNPELLRDPSKLPLNANPLSGYGDGFAWDLCESMMNKWDEQFGTLDPNSMAVYTYHKFYEGLVGQFATQGSIWRDIVENQERTVYAAEQERQNIMGVSTDEELSDLIKFQQCYNASSRYITVVDEMLEHLIMSL